MGPCVIRVIDPAIIEVPKLSICISEKSRSGAGWRREWITVAIANTMPTTKNLAARPVLVVALSG